MVETVTCSPIMSPSLFAGYRRHIRFAQTCRRLGERIEHYLKVESRAADDLKHVGSGGLLLEGLAQIVGALVQLVEQACVLNGDDGLIRVGGDQLDLLLGER